MYNKLNSKKSIVQLLDRQNIIGILMTVATLQITMTSAQAIIMLKIYAHDHVI